MPAKGEVKNLEVTVQDVLYPDAKIPFHRIKTAEEGFISLANAQEAKKFSKNECYEVQVVVTDKGYKNDGILVRKLSDSEKQPPKQYTRPSTSNSDALHIYVNGKLAAFIGVGEIKLALTEIVEATDLLVEAYFRSKLSGNKAQTRDDLNDELPYL